jgi:hypothetical protein
VIESIKKITQNLKIRRQNPIDMIHQKKDHLDTPVDHIQIHQNIGVILKKIHIKLFRRENFLTEINLVHHLRKKIFEEDHQMVCI